MTRSKILLAVIALFLLAGSARSQTPPPHQVALTWTASPSTGVTGYNLYRFSGGCPTVISLSVFTKLTTIPQAGLTYTDAAVTAGMTYCYTVTALNSSNESSASNALQVLVPIAPTSIASNVPGAPATLSSTSVQ